MSRDPADHDVDPAAVIAGEQTHGAADDIGAEGRDGPTVSTIREPQMRRERMSRPWLSRPSQKAAEGPQLP